MGAAGLVIHTNNRLEVLLEHLAARLRADPLPPLQDETILVPGRAIARWLRLQLAARLGIAGSLDLPFPQAFLHRLAAAQPDGPGPAAAAEEDPFAEDTLLLRVFRLLGDAGSERELRGPAAYCQDDPDQRKRWQLAERVSACLHAYQLHRPDLLEAWARGEDTGSRRPHHRWQAFLWRALLRETAGEIDGPGRGEPGMLPFAPARTRTAHADPHRLRRVRELLAGTDAGAVLPPRLSAFGLAALPQALVEVLHGIARHREVTVYLLAPTDRWFADPTRPRGAAAAPPGPALLASLGQQARETFDLLLDADPRGERIAPLQFVDPGANTALQVLQSDLLRAGDRPGAPVPLRPDDDSLRVHGCHSPLREMQVLRDQILAAMEQDPELRPGDVVVLVPDIAAYAPYVQAAFGPLRDRLPFQIADRSPAAATPMLAALLRVLELATEEPRGSDVLGLLEEPSLRRRFALTAADAGSARNWLERTRARLWRTAEGNGGPAPPHTFALARQRLLLGVATGPVDALVAGVLPDADATDARGLALGRLLDLFDALAERWQALRAPHAAARWAEELEATAARLLQPESPEELRAQEQIAAAARALRQRAALADLREGLSPAVFRDWLHGFLARAGEAGQLFAGGITFAALLPMRALPAPMLCIAGLNDGAFPRRDRPAPFDLVALEPRAGDPSLRGGDRHLFLEALLSARSRLVLTWVSRSQKDDSTRAPSPVLAELLQHLDGRLQAPDGGPATAWLHVQHPLQSFSERYRDGEDARLFTYAPPAPERAEAAPAAAPFVPLPLGGGEDAREIALPDLLEFWHNPARAFCRRTLQLTLPRGDDRASDAEPFALHELDRYQLQNDAVARALRRGDDPEALPKALQRGVLPALSLGPVAFAGVDVDVAVFRDRIGSEPPPATELRVEGDGFLLRARIELGPHGGPQLWRMTRVKAKDRVRAWLQHLVFHAARPGSGQPTRLHGTIGSLELRPPPLPAQALEWLTAMVDGMRQGLRAPLPFFPSCSNAFQESLARGDDAGTAVRRARHKWRATLRWEGADPIPGDGDDPYVALCWRDQDPLVLPDFATWSERVFGPLLGLQERR